MYMYVLQVTYIHIYNINIVEGKSAIKNEVVEYLMT